MFCRNCGKELGEGARFCSGCGCSVSDAGVLMPPKAIHSGKNAGTKKRTSIVVSIVAVLLIVGIALGAGLWKFSNVLNNTISNESVRNVKFEDFLVERCIREVLGKDWDEAVTVEELSSIKELVISWKKDITLGLDMVNYNLAYSGYVNLADLKYLTGLEIL